MRTFNVIYTQSNGTIDSVQSSVTKFNDAKEAKDFFEAKANELIAGVRLTLGLLDWSIAFRAERFTMRIESTIYVIAIIEEV